MITAGVNVVRLNFSHGTAEEHIKRADIVRNIALKLGRPVGVLCDLQGPKIRIGKFELGKVTLKTGDCNLQKPAALRYMTKCLLAARQKPLHA